MTIACRPDAAGRVDVGPGTDPADALHRGGSYDFDLAEFPLFRLSKRADALSGREPLRYEDTITGPDGDRVSRSWAVYPGPFGFGGASAQVLLFDLLQLYAEQGGRGTQIHFGTLRSLLVRRGERNPSSRDYARVRRDFDVLRGYDIHCRNAFWDAARRRYVDMNWRLFGAVFYFKPGPRDGADGQPYGFVEVSPALQSAVRARGLFALGFDCSQFYSLRPLEQRLALYLAKHFTSQKLHRRFVPDLARAMPIEAGRGRDVRATLRAAATGLIEKRIPILAAFRLELSPAGCWLATFTRGATTRHPFTAPGGLQDVTPETEGLLLRVADAVGSADDRVWWTRCAERLGVAAMYRALGLLKEARRARAVANPGGLLTKIIKDIASEQGVLLTLPSVAGLRSDRHRPSGRDDAGSDGSGRTERTRGTPGRS